MNARLVPDVFGIRRKPAGRLQTWTSDLMRFLHFLEL